MAYALLNAVKNAVIIVQLNGIKMCVMCWILVKTYSSLVSDFSYVVAKCFFTFFGSYILFDFSDRTVQWELYFE